MESTNNNKQYAVCDVAAAAVRKEPSHKSEMVNQLVYGEPVEVLAQKDEWHHVRSLYDGYEGWVTFHLIRFVAGDITGEQDFNFTKELFTEQDLVNGEKVYLPMGSFLNQHQTDTRVINDGKLFAAELIRTANKWLHAPYLWGGKTFMGVDCSGFVQTIFKVHGIVLKRDAYQQAEQGVPQNLADAKPGDLAFFNNEAGRITHVGILINNMQIIHAAGRVRIDAIDTNGIQNKELKKQTHNLHSVRRMFD